MFSKGKLNEKFKCHTKSQMKSISLGQYFCSLLLITLIINVIAIVSVGPLAEGRGSLKGPTFWSATH